MDRMEFKAGETIKIDYPFWKDEAFHNEFGDEVVEGSWYPGVTYVWVDNYCGEPDSYAVYDGTGKQVLEVVDVHKPGKYPTRVFYTMSWIAPDGYTFGKSKLRIASLIKFRRMCRGYMSHHPSFEMQKRETAP